MQVPILQVRNLSYQYEKRLVLDDINFDLHQGDFFGVIGANGSGKSTLIKLILQLLKLQKGSIELFDQPIAAFSNWERVSFVSQKANAFNSGFPATVEEVVASGLAKKTGLFRPYTRKQRQACQEALRQVGMLHLFKRNIGELSGGQQQRVFIARALVAEPELLILDEPTVGVDESNINSFYQLLANLNEKRQLSILLITHDVELILSYATHILSLNHKMGFFGTPEEFRAKRNQELHDVYCCVEHETEVLK